MPPVSSRAILNTGERIVILLDVGSTVLPLEHISFYYQLECLTLLLKVVVVNQCFTSLFGTNGLLSDIVIR